MSGILGETEITERDFESLCRLAEDVVFQLRMNYHRFDDRGNENSREQRLALINAPEDQLLEDLFCRAMTLERCGTIPPNRSAPGLRL